MKIAFLAAHSSIHTVKWVNEMALRGHDVYLITMHHGEEKLNKNIKVYNLPFQAPWGYYLNASYVKKNIKQHQTRYIKHALCQWVRNFSQIVSLSPKSPISLGK